MPACRQADNRSLCACRVECRRASAPGCSEVRAPLAAGTPTTVAAHPGTGAGLSPGLHGRQEPAGAVRALAAARQVQDAPGPHAGGRQEAGHLLPPHRQGAPSLTARRQLRNLRPSASAWLKPAVRAPAAMLVPHAPQTRAARLIRHPVGRVCLRPPPSSRPGLLTLKIFPTLHSTLRYVALAAQRPPGARRASACCSTTTGTACRGRPPTARSGSSTRATRSTSPCPCLTCRWAARSAPRVISVHAPPHRVVVVGLQSYPHAVCIGPDSLPPGDRVEHYSVGWCRKRRFFLLNGMLTGCRARCLTFWSRPCVLSAHIALPGTPGALKRHASCQYIAVTHSML